MQKAPVMKGSGLLPLDDNAKSNDEEVVHVFGKNLEERVVTNDDESPSISFSTSQSNQNEDDIEAIRKRKFDAITGEEDEQTIFQGEFKLFVWDLKTSNWIERGRGQLKLNDSIEEKTKSRIIMRVSGTHRIILNVAIKRSYFRVIASSKTNIRFTDSQTVWAASGSNANQLRDLLDERLTMAAVEECEMRKKTKSEILDLSLPSKKTRAESGETIEPKKPENTESKAETSEAKSSNEDSNPKEIGDYDDGDEEGEDDDSDENDQESAYKLKRYRHDVATKRAQDEKSEEPPERQSERETDSDSNHDQSGKSNGENESSCEGEER